MKIIALLSILVLCACASEPVENPVTVDTPVAKSCEVATVAVPVWPTSLVRPTDTVFIKVQAAFAELKLRAAYELQLLAAATACQK
jgi:hypothetical protein